MRFNSCRGPSCAGGEASYSSLACPAVQPKRGCIEVLHPSWHLARGHHRSKSGKVGVRSALIEPGRWGTAPLQASPRRCGGFPPPAYHPPKLPSHRLGHFPPVLMPLLLASSWARCTSSGWFQPPQEPLAAVFGVPVVAIQARQPAGGPSPSRKPGGRWSMWEEACCSTGLALPNLPGRPYLARMGVDTYSTA